MVSGVLVATALVASAALIVEVHRGPVPPSGRTATPPERARSATRLDLAGSGGNVPLTRKLAAAFVRSRPDVNVIVHDAIGSTGGARAVADGTIDLALMSRPLRESEQQLTVAAYARVRVVVAAHPGVSNERLTPAQLVALYQGKRMQWRDGRDIIVIQRERGDSGHRAVAAAIPGFGAANEESWHRGRFRVVYSDRAMEAALLSTSGAIGIADAGAIAAQRLPLEVFDIGDITKELAFAWRGTPSPLSAEFLAFVRSPEGRAIIAASGYAAIAGGS